MSMSPPAKIPDGRTVRNIPQRISRRRRFHCALLLVAVATVSWIAPAVQAQTSRAPPSYDAERQNIETIAKAMLSRAQKGKPFTSPRGAPRIPLMIADKNVGHLWRDSDLKALTIGNFWEGGGGTKIELLLHDRVVGMMWVE